MSDGPPSVSELSFPQRFYPVSFPRWEQQGVLHMGEHPPLLTPQGPVRPRPEGRFLPG
jgi:hypothetical protein